MRILFITATRIGDAVLSTGLLDHLPRTDPEADITIVCGPAAEGVFARMPRRRETIIVDKRRFDVHWLELWWRTVPTLWDLVVDLRGSALSFLVPARRRAVMRGGRRPGHRLGHLGSVLQLNPPPLPVVWTAAADQSRAEALIPGPGPVIAPVIALGPTAKWEEKVWPAERFVALFRGLAGALPGARPAVFAGPGPGERRAAERVLAGLPGAIDLAGRLSLAEVAACFARCALYVGNDSGLMRLAAAAGVPTLGLFGPSSASEYAPAGRCTGFVAAPGPEGAAPIAALGVAEALAAARELLARAALARAA
ncbi:MAG: glycosyltransferase family 9 protein [Acidisphaera sp.]|nr:glycosyltransferase family 9 protein [Acidisphaera sp.]